MPCDMCSGPNAIFKVEVEGSRLTICEKCSRFGNLLGRVQVAQKPVKTSLNSPILPQKKTETIQVIKSDYSASLRKARDKLGITQEELAKRLMEKESVLHKIESGHMKPDLVLARKLEKALKVELVEQVEVEAGGLSPEKKVKGEGLTLGDLISLK